MASMVCSVRLGFSEAAASRFTALILAADRPPMEAGGRAGIGERRVRYCTMISVQQPVRQKLPG
jgi:hypothetical protein